MVLGNQTITRRQILDPSKLKEFADDNFTFDENDRKLSKRVENTVGKGEIARHEQFLFFPQCFQKICFPGASKGVIVWEWVKHVCKRYSITQCYFSIKTMTKRRHSFFSGGFCSSFYFIWEIKEL